MRIAISALVGMTVTICGASALAQPSAAPAGPQPPRLAAAPRATIGETPNPSPPSPPVLVAEPQDERPEVVGWRDGFFLRDPHDYVRFYPHILAEADFYSTFGPGVTSVTAPDVAAGFKPRLSLRRARIGFDAELFKRWSVTALIEFGGQALSDTNGAAETAAAKPGQAPTAATGRYGSVQAIASAPIPADVYIGYSVCKCFNIEIGQFNAPFSLDNRTGDDYYPMNERPAAIRSFVMPSPRDIGGLLWGELGPRVFNYEVGIFGGDGQNRPSVDSDVDFIGRMYARPFAGGATNDLEKYTQIGVSARHGDRDPTAVAYDMTAITTGEGYALWKPTYTDSLGRQIHVIPSGAQNEIGGELRLQDGRFALQSEAYYLVNNTREAVDGYQLTNTERFGRMLGVGWYAQVSAWPFGDAFLTPEPGVYRPRHLDLSGRPSTHTPRGIEVIALVSGINGSYKGATRLDSTPDTKTPASDITIYQLGLGANYWHSKHARFGVYYSAYVTPGSGTSSNQAVVPANLNKQADGSAGSGNVMHEVTARVAVTF